MAGKIRKASDAVDRPEALLADIRSLILAARRAAVRSVDTLQVLTSFEIGRRIVEHEQCGATRATYGKQILKDLADRLTAEFGRGFSRSNLEYMRKFFLAYRERLLAISQMPSGKLTAGRKTQTASGKFIVAPSDPPSSIQARVPFPLGWSQYVFLMGINNSEERDFYEIESAKNGWALPELKRQFNASLYERLALSRDKAGIRKLAREGQAVANPRDLLKEPYVLEFLGLDEQAKYSETDRVLSAGVREVFLGGWYVQRRSASLM